MIAYLVLMVALLAFCFSCLATTVRWLFSGVIRIVRAAASLVALAVRAARSMATRLWGAGR